VLSELRAKRVAKAAEVAASLIKLDAANPLYQTLLGVVDVAQRDYAGAESAFRAALARNPEFGVAARDLAQLYLATGRADDAKNVYRELLSKKAGDVTALLGLADIAMRKRSGPRRLITSTARARPRRTIRHLGSSWSISTSCARTGVTPGRWRGSSSSNFRRM